jgi:hypothetical protein
MDVFLDSSFNVSQKSPISVPHKTGNPSHLTPHKYTLDTASPYSDTSAFSFVSVSKSAKNSFLA